MQHDVVKVGPYVLLFGLLYAAFGAASPFLPALIQSRGVPAEQIGLIFGLGTAFRLLSAPIAGRLADRAQSLRLTLAVSIVASALVVLGYLAAAGFWMILAVSLMHALTLAPTTNLADAITVTAAGRRGFEYGWVRGAGSAAFISASIAGGAAVSWFGLDIVAVIQALLMLAAAGSIILVEPVSYSNAASTSHAAKEEARGSALALLRMPVFRRILAVSALILGSHALHDTFSMIRWINAGISPQVASMLWSLAVAAEVVVFFLVGPWLINSIGPRRAIAIAAVVGALRWLISALTVNIGVIALIQPLHGVTFALLHLACMRLLAANVPPQLAATAQALYGTVGVGIASAFLTVASGWMYATMGGKTFLVMSGLCLLALPLAVSLGCASETSGRTR